MGLIKRRPRIRVRLPRVVHPGSECVAEVTLDARRPVPIEALEVRLCGVERAYGSAGADRLELLDLGAQLSGPRLLPRGETRFSCRFALPQGLPPSYEGLSASTAYSIEVRADIPWWPDAHGAFVVHVARPAPAVSSTPPQPRVYSSNPAGPKGTEPYLELSLADGIVPANGAVVGAVALGNTAHNEYTGLALALVPVQTVRINGSQSETRGNPHRARLSIDRAVEGRRIPFSLRVPSVHPTDRSLLWSLDWKLEARVTRRFGRDLAVEVPLVIVGEGARPTARSAAAAPTLGSERVERVWRGVAQELGLRIERESMLGVVDDTKLRIWREHRGRSGMRLFAELAYPSLNLELDGGEVSGARRLLSLTPAPGPSPWEERHRVDGREREQVLSVWRTLFDPLVGPNALDGITLAQLGDERLLLELADAGQNAPPLERLARAAVTLARLVPRARAQVPPPAAMKAALGAWQDLARSLGGTLEQARMAIACELDSQPAEIVTHWDTFGKARHTEVSLRPEPALRIRWLFEWSEAAGVTSGDLGDLNKSACEVFVELEREAALVSIAADRLTAMLTAPLADPAPARLVLLRLSALADALRSRAGAYR